MAPEIAGVVQLHIWALQVEKIQVLRLTQLSQLFRAGGKVSSAHTGLVSSLSTLTAHATGALSGLECHALVEQVFPMSTGKGKLETIARGVSLVFKGRFSIG